MPIEPALSRAQRLRHAVTALGPALAVAIVTLLATVEGADWYDALTLPSFALPGWVFGAGEALTGLLIGFAFDRVLGRPDWMPDRPAAIRAFCLQAGLSALWPLAFFGLRSPIQGLAVMVALLAVVSLAAQRFGRVDRRAGLCAALCGVWTLFATLVSLSIVIRN